MPERIALVTGSRVARSSIANYQRCVNYFPEKNPPGSLVPLTHYQRPGLRPVAQGPAAPVRGLWRASNGQCYAVIGGTVYTLGPPPTWVLTAIGQVAGGLSNLCSMVDNGIEALLVDGSQQGYAWSLAENLVAPFVDSTGTFQGADRVDVLDGFILWNNPGTNQWGSTLEFVLQIDPTYVATKANYPDPLQGLIVNHREIILIGHVSAEPWYNAGNAAFPFAELPGAKFEHGTVAKYSMAAGDVNVYYLGQNRNGQGVVMRARNYDCVRISNHELEVAIRKMAQAGTISDAIGFCYQQDGHLFYVLTFPTGNQTWVFDESSDEWSQWTWTDKNGTLNRFRGQCFAHVYGWNLVGDWQNGTIYVLDPLVFTDTVNGTAGPISFIRGFPHIPSGTMNLGAQGLDRPVPWAGQQMQYTNFVLDLECGTAPTTSKGTVQQVALRWSTNRGKTFGQDVLMPTGEPGQYATQPQWRALGVARDMVFEIEHQIPGEAALNGAWVTATVLGN